MRLDEAKLDELRRWGRALREAGDEGSVAAGRAILMLIEETERLRLRLRLAGEQLEPAHPVSNTEAGAGPENPVASALHARLQHVLDRDPGQSVETEPKSTGPGAESDSETSSQSWIDTLRRQK